MRTNIVLDEKLIERAQKLTGIKTKIQETVCSEIMAMAAASAK